MKTTYKQLLAGLALMLSAGLLLATDIDLPQFQPCWRNQPGTTFQKWLFGPNPSVFEGFYGPVTLAADVSNNLGSPAALVAAESTGVGWTLGDLSNGSQSQFSATNFGWWDIGYNSQGTITLTIPGAAGPSGSTRYIALQITEAILPGTLDPAAVAVLNGTQIVSNSVMIEAFLLGGQPADNLYVYQYVFQVPGNTTSDTITLTSAATDTVIGGVVVETMLRSPAQNDIATVAPGNMVSIPVLANDGGPNLTIASVGTVGGVGGTAHINGANIDFTAPPTAGTATFTYVNRDCSNNTSTATVTVNVLNLAPPVITTCAADQTNLISGCTGPVPDLTSQVVAAGSGVAITQSPAAGTSVGLGVTTVTLTASNAAGAVTCTARVTFQENTPPMLGAMPANIVVTRTDSTGATNITYTLPTATDNCDPSPSVVCTPPSGSTFPLGVTTVTCVATDASGNSSSNTFSVTVQTGFTYADRDLLLVYRKDGYNDVIINVGPVSSYLGLASGTGICSFSSNPSVLANFGGSMSGVKYALLAATALSDPTPRVWLSDAYPDGTPANEPYSMWAGQRGKIKSLGTAAAASYTSSNQVLIIPPTDTSSYTYIMSDGGASDITTLGGAVPFPVEQDVNAGARLFQIGINSTATEVGGFNPGTGSCSMQFTAGYLPVQIVVQPANITTECGSNAVFTVVATGEQPLGYAWFKGSTPVDGNTSTLVYGPVTVADSGSVFHVVVIGGGGNPATSADATLTVVHTRGPVITLNGASRITNACGTAYSELGATAFDVCDNASVAVTIDASAVNVNAAGTYPVNYTATDSANHTTTVTRTVVVASVIPPVVTLAGSPAVTVECHTAWSDPGASATSVCGGTPLPIITLGAANLNSVGTYTLTYYALDGSLSNGVTRIVTVQDTTAPVLHGLPANIVVQRTDSAGATNIIFTPPTATDTCDGAPTVVCTPPSGSTLPLGVNTVTCVASDASGNHSSGTFTVTVNPGFTYSDADLLLVFRKDTYNDAIINLGPVSAFTAMTLGQSNCFLSTFDARVLANFGGSMAGVKYALLAATPLSDPTPRVWLSDAYPDGTPANEPFSMWAGQRGKIKSLGTAAAASYTSSNQVLIIPPTDTSSYTYIMSEGGAYDITTLGGAVPFPVEQDVTGPVRLFQIGINAPATEVGSVYPSVSGGCNLGFTAGFLPVVITAQPANTSAECTGIASFTVSATGEPPLSYQWYHGSTPVGINSATLVINPVSFADAGNYTVVVSGNGLSSVTSAAATLTVRDTTAPFFTFCPPNTNLVASGVGTIFAFAPTAADSCDGVLAPVCTPPSGSTFLLGSNWVTCVATDSHGNAANCGFFVKVESFGAGCVTNSYAYDPPIPDANGNGWANTLYVSSQVRAIGTNDSIKVNLTISNCWNGDLYAYLVHTTPSGLSKYAVLLNRVGRAAVMSHVTATPFGYDPLLGYEDPGFNVTFADTAVNGDIHFYGLSQFAPGTNDLQGHPLTGIWQPDGRGANPTNVLDTDGRTKMLSEFQGMDPNGEWTLFVSDVNGGYISEAFSWSMEICGNFGPLIEKQTGSQVAECGSTVTNAVYVSGYSDATSPITFQWYKGTNAVLNETNSAMVLNKVHPSDSGIYSVLISNATHYAITSAPVTLTVVDTIAPVLTVTASGTNTTVIVECHTAYTELGATATDICAGDLTSSIVTTSTVDANTPGTYTVTYTVSDGFNTTTATRTVIVRDTTLPIVTLNGPSSYTVECPHTWTEPGATALDTCSGSLPVTVIGSVNVHRPGVYTLTYSAMDASGNVGTATRTVTVVDTLPPSITLNGSATMTVQCHSSFVDPGATAADSCAGNLLVTSSGAVDVNTPATYHITYSVSDGVNPVVSAIRTVNVVDTTPPVVALIGPSTIILECHNAWIDPGATAYDVCAGTLTAIPSGTVDANTPGTYTVTYTATDAQNNHSAASRTVIVQDTIAPAITCPTNMVVGAAASTNNAVVTFTTTVTDACDTGAAATCTPASGSRFNLGTTTVTCSVYDASGNYASCHFAVTVVDNQPPVVALNGASNVVVECHLGSYKELGAKATDNSGSNVVVTILGSVNTNVVGAYTLTYRAIDASGNIGTAIRTVAVIDTTPPLVTLVGSSSLVVECHTSFTDPGATARDACAGALEVTVAGGPVNVNNPGTTVLTYTATDPSGNTASAIRTVIVHDTLPPVMALKGPNLQYVECHTNYVEQGVVVSDLCDTQPTIVTNLGTLNASVPGTYTVTYTATDHSTNSVTITRTVIVRDTTAPVVTLNGDSVVVLECIPSWTDPGATYSDVCAGTNLMITTNGTVDVTRPGVYTLVYTATDPSHNSGSATRTVIVQDTQPPTVTLGGNAEVTVECHTEFVDPGATAVNGCAGPLDVDVLGYVDVNTPGIYYLVYIATDSFGNSTYQIRTVTVVDSIAPTLVLNGASPQYVECHTPYVELGASAIDACAGMVPVAIISTVNTNVTGSYTVTYLANDGNGNSNQITRNVIVRDTNPPVLSLPTSIVTTRTMGAGAKVSFTASAVDSCAGAQAVTCTNDSGKAFASGEVFPLGATTLHCWAADPAGNTATGSFSVTVQEGDGYVSTDLILVLHKLGYDDVIYNLGNVSNYLNLACGSYNLVNEWDVNLALAAYGGSLEGVSFTLMAATGNETAPAVWLADGSSDAAPANEALAAWVAQSNVIAQVGSSLNTYDFGPHKSLELWVADHGSYTYIASGGTYNGLSNWISVAPFVVEQTVPGAMRFFQVDTTGAGNARQQGGFSLSADGQLIYTKCNLPPMVSMQPTPSSQTVECSSNTVATFTVAATGDEPLSYQWYKVTTTATNPITGATSSTLTLNHVSFADQGNYLVVVMNDVTNSVTSEMATLYVEDTVAPTLNLLGTNPQRVTCGAYTDSGATASDACAGDLTSSIITISTVVPDVQGIYTVFYMVSDAAGNVSSATRTVIVEPEAPAISLADQPRDVLFANVGSNVTFSVAAYSCGPQTYQWYVNSVAPGNALAHETNAILILPNVQYALNGNHYIVVVENSFGTTESRHALLTVNRFPVAFGLGAGTTENAPVQLPFGKLYDDDYDPDMGDTIVITNVSPLSAHSGTVTLDTPNQVIIYTPAHGFHGVDSFNYIISDKHGARTTGLIQVYVADGVLPSENAVNITAMGGGILRVRYVGLPGENYTLMFTGATSPLTWLDAPAAAMKNGSTVRETAQPYGIIDWFVDSAFLPPATMFRVEQR